MSDQETHMGTLWMHVKSKGVYTVFSSCQIEATNEEGVLYHSVEGKGPLWCRPASEFLDGRFLRVGVPKILERVE